MLFLMRPCAIVSYRYMGAWIELYRDGEESYIDGEESYIAFGVKLYSFVK